VEVAAVELVADETERRVVRRSSRCASLWSRASPSSRSRGGALPERVVLVGGRGLAPALRSMTEERREPSV